jgi:hypothetical protein
LHHYTHQKHTPKTHTKNTTPLIPKNYFPKIISLSELLHHLPVGAIWGIYDSMPPPHGAAAPQRKCEEGVEKLPALLPDQI